MEKAIYGLAMPFNDSYWEYDFLTNTFVFETTNYESTELWNVIKLTIDHDHSRTLGSTDNGNLFVKVTDSGVFFKFIPVTPEGYKAYKDVKDRRLRHCSVTYLRRTKRDYDEEKKYKSLIKLMNWNDNVIVKKFKEALVDEMCLTNTPGNDNTFCTTDPNDPRLKRIDWS